MITDQRVEPAARGAGFGLEAHQEIERLACLRSPGGHVAHLDDVRRRLRSFKKIHVICDNAPFHNCRTVADYLQCWGHRIVLHYLPKYAPQTNPIERVWWHLHEVVTRNHRCQSIDELLELAYQWFAANNNHYLDMHHTFALAA
jgi:hypothetical protein